MYKNIINNLSKQLNLSEEVVEKVYNAFWLAIRDNIQNLPLKEDLTEPEFLKLKTNFNLPSIGKLCCTYEKYKYIKNKNNESKKSKTDV